MLLLLHCQPCATYRCNIIANCAHLGVLYIGNAEIMCSVQMVMDRKVQNKREKNLSKSLC